MKANQLPPGVRALAVGAVTLAAVVVIFLLLRQSPAGLAFQPTPTVPQVEPTESLSLPSFEPARDTHELSRETILFTEIPENRPRYGIIEYIVQPGDSAWSIAQKYNLKPETILWGNEGLSYIAGNLAVSTTLKILPTDGVLHRVAEEDDWDRIELLYGVPMTTVVSYPANGFPLDGPFDLELGRELIIPGGRSTVFWVDPGPQVDPKLGRKSPGYYSGPLAGMGTGYFIWPVAPPIVINQDYWEAHPAIDIDVYFRQPIYAADSGTVIFSGWSNAGYGNLVIIDHGNDFWTYYAHNETIFVSNGQGVLQGQQIAEGGTTGNSTGYHLDFRVRYKAGNFHNPMQYLPPLP